MAPTKRQMNPKDADIGGRTEGHFPRESQGKARYQKVRQAKHSCSTRDTATTRILPAKLDNVVGCRNHRPDQASSPGEYPPEVTQPYIQPYTYNLWGQKENRTCTFRKAVPRCWTDFFADVTDHAASTVRRKSCDAVSTGNSRFTDLPQNVQRDQLSTAHVTGYGFAPCLSNFRPESHSSHVTTGPRSNPTGPTLKSSENTIRPALHPMCQTNADRFGWRMEPKAFGSSKVKRACGRLAD